MSKLIDIEKHDGITRVTLNRPDALNALSLALRQAIAETFFELAEDTETEVIILTGAGRAFTVGLDLKELGGEIPASASASASASAAGAGGRERGRGGKLKRRNSSLQPADHRRH